MYVCPCMHVAAWSDLCETHIVGPSGVLTGYYLLVIYLLLITDACTHTLICFNLLSSLYQ